MWAWFEARANVVNACSVGRLLFAGSASLLAVTTISAIFFSVVAFPLIAILAALSGWPLLWPVVAVIAFGWLSLPHALLLCVAILPAATIVLPSRSRKFWLVVIGAAAGAHLATFPVRSSSILILVFGAALGGAAASIFARIVDGLWEEAPHPQPGTPEAQARLRGG